MTNAPGSTMQVLVLGGGYAGMLAALRLAGRVPGPGIRILLVNDGDAFVERIRLHQHAAGQALVRHSIPALLLGSGVELLQARVVGIDAPRRRVRVLAEGRERELGYDTLVYALGSRGDVDSVPGAREHAIPVASAFGAARLRIAATRGDVVVVGGGLTGIESAAEIAESRPQARVSLVTAGELGERLGPRARRHLRRVLERMRIGVVEGTRVARVDEAALATNGGSTIRFDVCIWAGSFRAPPLAREAGFEVDGRGRIAVDETLRSVSHPDAFAVGDAACPVEIPYVGMDCASALPMGAHAADGIAALLRGRKPRPFRFAYAAKCISLGRRDGIVQRLNADGSPRGLALTGRLAALVKEGIGRFTIWSLRHPMAYGWPGRAAETGKSRAGWSLSRA